MDYDWKQYHSFANIILDSDYPEIQKETLYRCSISRAYYSAFIISRNYLLKRDYLKRADTRRHENIINRYKELGLREYNTVGHKLQGLKIKRQLADYEDTIDCATKECCEKCLDDSKEIIVIITNMS